jgi:uncharacterized protein YjbI with pentapeptide repeats
VIVLVPNVSAQEAIIPSWVKNNADWWASDLIDDNSFVSGIQWLVSNDIIQVPPTIVSDVSETTIPDWVKNNAGWWADNKISEDEFVNAIQYLIKRSVIHIPNQNVSLNSCEFEHIPALNELDNEIKMKICLSKEIAYLKESLIIENAEESINSFGFRGPEFSKEKPESTIRIFLVGGSTMVNAEEPIEFTIAGYLQKKINNLNLDYNVEVINAGIGSAWSKTETKMIKEKIFDLQPDLIFVYDGWNDLGPHFDGESNEKIWSERWQETCELGKKMDVKIIVTLQALLGFGDRLLTDQEYKNYFISHAPKFQQFYPLYIEQLNKLSDYCTDTADLTKILDYAHEPLIYDNGHTLRTGNKIISENILKLIIPSLSELTNFEINIENDREISDKPPNKLQITDFKNVFVGASLNGRDFSNQDLSNTDFFGANLDGANFSNSNLSNSDFRLANLQNANFHNAIIDSINLERAKLNGSDFSNVDFTNTDLKYVNLANVNLSGSDLSHMDLKYTILMQADLSHANVLNSVLSSATVDLYAYLIDTDIRHTNFSESQMLGIDFTKVKDKNLEGTIFTDAQLTHVNLEGIDFSGKDLTMTNFANSNLIGSDFSDNVIIHGVDFGGAYLTNANFEGANLQPKKYHEILFENAAYLAELSYGELAQELLKSNTSRIISTEVRENDLRVSFYLFNNFYDANLENTNFSNSNLRNNSFVNANLYNANLSGADLRSANLTNADLDGANLTGVKLEGAILNCKNHVICENIEQ